LGERIEHVHGVNYRYPQHAFTRIFAKNKTPCSDEMCEGNLYIVSLDIPLWKIWSYCSLQLLLTMKSTDSLNTKPIYPFHRTRYGRESGGVGMGQRVLRTRESSIIIYQQREVV